MLFTLGCFLQQKYFVEVLSAALCFRQKNMAHHQSLQLFVLSAFTTMPQELLNSDTTCFALEKSIKCTILFSFSHNNQSSCHNVLNAASLEYLHSCCLRRPQRCDVWLNSSFQSMACALQSFIPCPRGRYVGV